MDEIEVREKETKDGGISGIDEGEVQKKETPVESEQETSSDISNEKEKLELTAATKKDGDGSNINKLKLSESCTPFIKRRGRPRKLEKKIVANEKNRTHLEKIVIRRNQKGKNIISNSAAQKDCKKGKIKQSNRGNININYTTERLSEDVEF